MIRRQVCIQHTRNRGLGMPDLESHWLAEKLARQGRSLLGVRCGDERRVRLFLASSQTQRLKVDVSRWAKYRFVHECRAALCNIPGSSDLSWPRKELYRELVVGFASDPLSERRGWTAEEIRSHWNLGARLMLLEQFRVLAHLAACTERVAPSRLELQSGPSRHA